MNRRGFLTAVAAGTAAFTLAACDPGATSGSGGGSDKPDCDADDLVEGDPDCGGKGAKPKTKTKTKPAKKSTKNTKTNKSTRTGSRSGSRR